MVRADPSQRMLLTGLLVSLLVHISIWAGAAGFVRKPLATMLDLPADPVRPKAAPKPRVKLGIDDGRVTSLAWLGFEEETPHQGPQAVVDQSAMTPSPGTPGTPALPAPPAPARAPTPPPPLVTSQQLQEAAQALSNMGTRLVEAMKAATPPPPPNPQPPATPTETSLPTAQGPGASESGQPGIASDKESIAASVKNAPKVRLGQVAAARGLDIVTRSPRWSITTMQTRRPVNPTLEITFGRDGKVVRAGFVTTGQHTYNTGSQEVDEPLISAVYSWLARGQRLAELTSQDPNGEVTIVITVILSG